MGWELSYDVEAFARAARAYLERDPARCTVLLTTTETLRVHGPGAFGDGDPHCGWWRAAEDGPVEAAFVHTPSFPPALGPMPERAARELAAVLRLTGTVLTGVAGVDGPVQAFADAWVDGRGDDRGDGRGDGQGNGPVDGLGDGTPSRWTEAYRLRLLRLAQLTPPQPAPPGSGRRATLSDVPLAAAWMRGFSVDTGQRHGVEADFTANVARRVDDGGLYLWEADGRPVAMAAHSVVIAGQARIGLVYTPPYQRGRGYGGAVTAAATRSALAAGARQVLLFADAANPTSNALYERLGYRLLGHHLDIDFT